LNFVIHRRNIDRLPQMIELAETLGAERVELANVQFYGWAFLNRAALLPTREQVVRAREIPTAAKARLAGRIDIFYVLPDYYEAVRELAAERDRVSRFPLPGRIAERKRCNHRRRLHVIPKSLSCGRSVARPKFIKRPSSGLDVPNQPKWDSVTSAPLTTEL